jgi:hypothetical protein
MFNNDVIRNHVRAFSSACGFASAEAFGALAKPQAAVTLIAVLALILQGCASYATPGGAANMKALGVSEDMREANTDGLIRQALDRKPLASFPTAIAVARVQATGYCSPTARGWGHGNYSVVTTRDIEKPQQIERLNKLQMVNGIAPLSRILLPENLQSDAELRQAAAQLHAEMLLIYTIDTQFKQEDKAAPLSVISLGLSPNQQIRVDSTASAVLMDTRNGYVYGLAEASEHQKHYTNAWQSNVAVDETPRTTESAAMEKLVGEVESTWRNVVARYATNASAG